MRVPLQPDDGGKQKRQRDGRDAQPEVVQHAADWKADGCTKQRSPQVDVGVGHAIELQILQHRLGDQSEPLSAARQRGEHDHRGDDDVQPSHPLTERAFPLSGDRGAVHRRGEARSHHRKNVDVLPYSA